MSETWTISASGTAIRFIFANAQALGEHDPDREWPDPIDMFAEFVKNGFAVPFGEQAAEFEVLSREPLLDRNEQHWTVRVRGLHPGYAHVLENLLRAPGSESFTITATSKESPEPRRLDTRVDYPPVPPIEDFTWDYQPPDDEGIVHERRAALEFLSPLQDEVSEAICAALDSWITIVWRSGFAPDDMSPSECGTMPTAAYPFDPTTIAVDFEGIFLVDEACFASLAAYANQLVKTRHALKAVQIESP